MAFPNGPLAGHFQTSDTAAPIPAHLQQGLLVSTRGLIGPFLVNTLFCRGVLSFAFVRTVPAFTIFSRRNLGNVPYLLTDLGSDLRSGAVDRATIDQPTGTRSGRWGPTWATFLRCLSRSSSKTTLGGTT